MPDLNIIFQMLVAIGELMCICLVSALFFVIYYAVKHAIFGKDKK